MSKNSNSHISQEGVRATQPGEDIAAGVPTENALNNDVIDGSQSEIQWQGFTHEALCSELKGIKGIPKDAVQAIATAVFLCAPLPGPVRKAWRRARGPLYALIAAFTETDYNPEMTKWLHEIRARLDHRRNYRLSKASFVGRSLLMTEYPDHELEFVDSYEEAVEAPSREVGLERFPSDGKVREHYGDFLVICARVLEEAGCKRHSENRRKGALKTDVAAEDSVLDLLAKIVEVCWNDSTRDKDSRTIETVRDAYLKATKNLPKDFPKAPDTHAPAGRPMIELLKIHREKRGARGLGTVWLRR